MQLQHIYLYPIKSTQAYGVEQAVVQTQGLNFDREFMLTEPDGKFITARKDGALYDFAAFPVPLGLQVHHRDGSVIFVRYQDFQQQSECEVWGNQFAAFVAPETINHWFSEKIGRAVQLRWLGEHSQRRIKRYPDTPLSFADGYPLLLCTRQSFDFLQQACPSPITINRFRPSIVIDGEVPFAEQTWDKIRIGEVTFLHTKPCERCVLTARDPQTKEIDAKMEPFRTLKKINANEEGKPLFGINLIPLNHGIIRLHDSVEVLSYR
ncbi:MOSC domain-containing protein [Caviibacterium pharyngocola]|uniref:MOSC domain-containing protein n=1 Tax=Caviibacterium pharyngocola TaxID=28159 RepID=A0A2M8RYM4_9PAST|nr:MOSC domain-containing protein [Caviibacterium pharyngocola]PJG83990.1 MOSC domain-containing protein [Caviibacterium pharyngocola]